MTITKRDASTGRTVYLEYVRMTGARCATAVWSEAVEDAGDFDERIAWAVQRLASVHGFVIGFLSSSGEGR